MIVAIASRSVQQCSVAEQLSLYPLRIVRVWNPSSQTVSRPRIATCEDGLDYCVKHDQDGIPVRANEWIATWLARAAGIAVAKPTIVRDFDNKLLFGSEIYGVDANDNLGIFQSNGLTRLHLNHIWKTFAFDLFIGNTDRHINQYRFFTQNRAERMISFDFGESLFRYWPDLDLPLSPKCNTVINIRAIQKNYGKIDLSAADEVLLRLETIEGAAMVNEVRGLPRGWLSAQTGSAFTRWFGGRLRRERVGQIREGLRNGTYL